jgi:membrane-associated protein
MSGELLALLTSYGLPALFLILMVTSAGVPFPDSLLLVAVGSFAEQGDLPFWPAVLTGIAGAVAGDQIGYAIGYWGGRPLAARLVGAERLTRARDFSRKWGGWGIFLSRWLVGPLGPWLNVTSGLTEYSWRRFVLIDVIGEAIWVLLYVSLGRLFSDQLQALADTLGELSWVVLGVALTGLLGWKLLRWRSAANEVEAVPVAAE